MEDIAYNFVLRKISKPKIDQLKYIDLKEDWRKFNHGKYCWILQSYLRLMRRGINVNLSNSFIPESINFAFNADLRGAKRPKNVFVVGIRADYPSVPWCQAEIVQNKAQLVENSIWLPHWPQSKLIARNANRRYRVDSIGYFGRSVNHYTRIFRTSSGMHKIREKIRNICHDMGLRFVEKGPECWNDFSDIDVVIGLRDFGNKTYDTKPATKLVNAWLAGAPFIGGADSAFLQVGSPGFDFLRATTPDSFRRQVERLRSDEHLFAFLVDQGRVRGATYDHETVAGFWEFAITGEITGRFERWRATQGAKRISNCAMTS